MCIYIGMSPTSHTKGTTMSTISIGFSSESYKSGTLDTTSQTYAQLSIAYDIGIIICNENMSVADFEAIVQNLYPQVGCGYIVRFYHMQETI